MSIPNLYLPMTIFHSGTNTEENILQDGKEHFLFPDQKWKFLCLPLTDIPPV